MDYVTSNFFNVTLNCDDDTFMLIFEALYSIFHILAL